MNQRQILHFSLNTTAAVNVNICFLSFHRFNGELKNVVKDTIVNKI